MHLPRMNWKRVREEENRRRLREADPTIFQQPDPGSIPADNLVRKEHESSSASGDIVAQRPQRQQTGGGGRRPGLGRGRRRGDKAANAWMSAAEPKQIRRNAAAKRLKMPNLGTEMKCRILERASEAFWLVAISKGRKGLLEHQSEFGPGDKLLATVVALEPKILLRRMVNKATVQAECPGSSTIDKPAPDSRKERALQLLIESQKAAIGRHEAAADTVIWELLTHTARSRLANKAAVSEIAGSVDVLADLFLRASLEKSAQRFKLLATRLRAKDSGC